MDMEKERELLWIAREGLKAKLPEDWKPCKSPHDEIYYFNFVTGESVWEHPCDQHYKKLYEEEKESLRKRDASAGSDRNETMEDEVTHAPAGADKTNEVRHTSQTAQSLSSSSSDEDERREGTVKPDVELAPDSRRRRSGDAAAIEEPSVKDAAAAHASDDYGALRERQTAAEKEVDLKFRVWRQQLLTATDAKKKRATSEHEEEMRRMEEDIRRTRDAAEARLAAARTQSEQIEEEAKQLEERSETMLTREKERLAELRANAENPAGLDDATKSEARERAIAALQEQVESEVQGRRDELTSAAMEKLHAEIDAQVEQESKRYRRTAMDAMARTIDDDVRRESDDRKQASFAVMYSELEVEKAKMRESRIQEMTAEVESEVVTEKERLMEAMMLDLKAELETLKREEKMRAEEAERLPETHVEPNDIDDATKSEARERAIAALQEQVESEVQGRRDELTSAAMEKLHAEIDAQVEQESKRYRRTAMDAMARTIDDDVHRESDDRKQRSLAALQHEVDEEMRKTRWERLEQMKRELQDEVDLEKEKMKDDAMKRVAAECEAFRLDELRKNDLEMRSKGSSMAESRSLPAAEPAHLSTSSSEEQEGLQVKTSKTSPDTQTQRPSRRRCHGSARGTCGADDSGVLDVIDRRMEELRMRHMVIAESRQMWHSMVESSVNVTDARHAEVYAIKRNIEREAKSVKEDVKSLRAVKAMHKRSDGTPRDNLTLLLASMEKKQSRLTENLGDHSLALMKMRMSLL